MSRRDDVTRVRADPSDDAEGDPLADTEGGTVAEFTGPDLTPADVFSLLGNDTRLDILRALLELGAGEEPVSFTDLFERVDVADSANFSYHLQRLTGHFVKQTDDGYRFRHPGRKVISAIFAGTLTDRAQLGFFAVEGRCYDCGGALHGWYVDDTLTVGCTDCAAIQVSYPFPSGGLDDRTTEEVMDAFHHYVRHHYCLAADGVCPECTGETETAVARAGDDTDLDVAVRYTCRRCGYRLRSPVGVALLDDADVLTFHAEHGVDLGTERFWTFDWCVSDERTTVLSADPLRVRVDIPCGDDELRVVVDDELSTVDATVANRLGQ
ncbi:transcriptional regulator [Salinigranum rubrum]|uniref:Transcriptional regulator n=1 Tax=Salinigranum rubrum TaxID=755307 RepID=A0A2I8VJP6_9EURY|nr:helix-turn-helix domain-containing protein [Salinigranum rubrum]AUV82152.1 transcriptional regulator [Salinigranum rubrum]